MERQSTQGIIVTKSQIHVATTKTLWKVSSYLFSERLYVYIEWNKYAFLLGIGMYF